MFHIECRSADGAIFWLAERTPHRVDAVGMVVELQPHVDVVEVDVVQETADGLGKVTHRFGRWPAQPGELVVTPQRPRVADRIALA